MSTGPADDFLDEIEGTPPPAPPAPPPVAVPPVDAPSRWARWRPVLETVAVALISAVLAVEATVLWLGDGHESKPAPVSAYVLGRTFAPKLAAALADGFEADADAVKAGKSPGEADKILKDTFAKARAKAFEEHAGAALTAILPDGKDFERDDKGVETKPEQRKTFEAWHREFARGLRKAR